MRTYSEMRKRRTLEERFQYLSLRADVGTATFGFDRYINQAFYRSREWRLIRDDIIVRDGGCDLGVPEWPIHDRVIIHHMNPMSVRDIVEGDNSILDPEYLVCVSHRVHNAIHYGDVGQLPRPYAPRTPGDTKLWSRS